MLGVFVLNILKIPSEDKIIQIGRSVKKYLFI